MEDHETPGLGLRRRTFLIGGAAGVTAVGLGLWRLWPAGEKIEPGSTVPALPPYGDWRDIYREKWRWEKVVRGTHTSANCVSACAWNLYVREGVVWREEQSAPYVASNASVPDWNPRGCQKGACYSDLATGPSRVRYPMKRVGARGAGSWRRISWEEALDEISTVLVGVLSERGGKGVVCEYGGHLDFGSTFAGTLRFFRQLGIPVTDATAMAGDLPIGGTITLGEPMVGGSSDDWFRSGYVVLWAFNPAATRIPDAHYVNEARYHGARVVSVAPDLNQSAVHADLWLSVRPGSDAALALAACQVILEEKLHDEAYITEQTDLPFLVHGKTGRFLRESDVDVAGSDERFAVWDGAASKLVWVPGCRGSDEKTLALPDGVRPDIEAHPAVTLASGERSTLGTVFSLLREGLSRFTPERAAGLTGLAPSVIRRFAREFAAAPAALIISSYGMCKNYHSDLVQRAQILLASLTGNIGKAGGGWRSTAYIALDGMALVAMQDKLDIAHLAWLGLESYLDPKDVQARFMGIFISSSLFHSVHGGLRKIQTAAAYGDPMLAKAGAAPYLDEALARSHFGIGPGADDSPPDFIFNTCGNVLRHGRMGNRLRDGLFSKARMVVDVTFRMSETARHADILLPAASWYEKLGLKYIPAYAPFVHLGDRAVAPLGESKPEWEIYALLAKKVGEEARRRGVTTVQGFRGDACDVAGVGERFTDDGRFGPEAEERVVDFILKFSGATKNVKVEDLRREGGAIRLKSVGPDRGRGIRSEYHSDEPVVPLVDSLVRKVPYPTLTGRQQFYIDHPWFLKLGEALPTYKEPPAAGGDHPFTMTGGHTRWSIHAVWRDHSLLLRLQRGEPVVLLNPADARQRGISDHDRVRVWNDLGEFEARAKLSGAIRPRQLHIFHAWEPYQFSSPDSHQALIPSPIKVTQLVGDYGQLHWTYGNYEPNQVDRDTRVDVARA